MSLASWIEEFYPVRADECPRDQALEHSILKWTGLLPENLEKHGVEKCGSYVQNFNEKNWLRIDGSSCALCQYYYSADFGCRGRDPCPIVLVTGKTCNSLYVRFIREGRGTSMLDLLCQVKEALDAPQV